MSEKLELIPLDPERQAIVKTWHRHVSDLLMMELLQFREQHPDLLIGWYLALEAGDGKGQSMQSKMKSPALWPYDFKGRKILFWDEQHEQRMREDPEYARRVEAYEREWMEERQ